MIRFFVLMWVSFFSLSALADCKIHFQHTQRHEFSGYDDVVKFCKQFAVIFGTEYTRCAYVQSGHKWRGDYSVRRVFVGENYHYAWLSVERYFTHRNLHRYPRNDYQFQFPNCY